MKWLPLCAAALALALPGANAVAAVPQRVMSINLCSDQLLLDLLPPERIASVTWLARENYGSYLTEKASHVALNHGTAEDVLAQKPDLVIADLYATAVTRAFLKRVGMPLLELAPAEDFDAIRTRTRAVGRAVGEEEKAEALLRQMDATLAELAATAPKRRIVVAGWEGDGQVPGPNTLFNAILNAAGGENIAATGSGYVKFDLERLLLAHPDLLAYGDSYTSTPSRRSEGRDHPVLRQAYAGRQLTYPQLLYACGLPQSADAARQLRKAMLDALATEAATP